MLTNHHNRPTCALSLLEFPAKYIVFLGARYKQQEDTLRPLEISMTEARYPNSRGSQSQESPPAFWLMRIERSLMADASTVAK